jgi:carbon storage regulator
MLVLTRKPGEQVVIANNIRLTIVSIGHGRVKIGIEAPKNVSIDRQEIHDRKQAEEVGADVPPVVVDVEPAILHNRIVDRLPQMPSQTPVATGKSEGYRSKPR